ncbi:MAG: hypothetical protein C5B43_03755, partial [Verrucomicrobia bacterium]
KKLIEYKFRDIIDTKCILEFSIKTFDELIDQIHKLETKSYQKEIATYAINTPFCYNALSCMGIDPDIYFNPNSSIFYEILNKFEEQDVDFTYDTNYDVGEIDHIKGIRYVASAILKQHEDEILSQINSDIKNNPAAFLKKLKTLKNSSSYNQYVLDKLIAQAEVWEVMQTIPKMKDFPFEDIWRFCIDIEFQKYGAYIFENEPGYIIATLKTLCFALKLQKPNVLDYVAINRKCGENVLEHFGGRNFNSKIRDGDDDVSFGIYDYDNMDKEGLQDLEERNSKPDSSIYFGRSQSLLVSFSDNKPRVSLTSRAAWEHLREMAFIFDQHEKKISASTNQGERLIAHIWASRELSLQHHFNDANGRASQLYFIALVAHDPELPMFLLDTNPNLDTNGPVAFTKRILQAMAHFNKICGKDEILLTFEQVDQMTNVSEKRFWSRYHPTEEERQIFIQQHPQEEFEAHLKTLKETAEPYEQRLWDYDYKKAKMRKRMIKIYAAFIFVPSVAIIFFLLFFYRTSQDI